MSHAGANDVPFSGRIGIERLKPARYRVALTAVDASLNASPPATRAFKIVKR
jgi:hypothetical protein